MDILNNFSVVADIKCESLEQYRSTPTCSEDSRYFAFITRNSVVAIDLQIEGNAQINVEDGSTGESKGIKEFKSNVPLSAITMKADGKYLCVGDQIGKIHYYYNIFSERGPTISTRHWHANRVNVLEFTQEGAFLLSGGKEAVVVMWHQITQQNSFISRVGNQIVNLSTSNDGSLIAISMIDNSIKVIKAQNYEIVQHFRGLLIEPGETKVIQNSKF